MKLYITAGHQVINGKGTGAHGFRDEAVEAVKLRDALCDELTQRGLSVLKEGEATSLNKVIDWLTRNVREKDIVIDIHFNAAVNPNAQGTEVLIPEKYTQTELKLAHDLAKAISASLTIPMRRGKLIYSGVKTETESHRSSIGILNRPWRAHNVLLEVAFVTNYKEMTDLYPNNFHALVHNLADVICNYAKA